MNTISIVRRASSTGIGKMALVVGIVVTTCLYALVVHAAAFSLPDLQNERTPAQANHRSPAPDSEQHVAGVSRASIPDLEVIGQNGNKIRFYSDLLKGKVVAINFIYTSCKAFCSLQGDNFSKLQRLLENRLGKDISLISISTDPEADTPERLKEWSKRFKAKTGWTMVTGDKGSIDAILMALTGDIGRTGMHSPVVLIGNVDKGAWVSEYGLTDPERLVAIINEIIGTPTASQPIR